MPVKTLLIDIVLGSGAMGIGLHAMHGYCALFVRKEFSVCRRVRHEEECRDAEKHGDYAFDEEDPRPLVVSTIFDFGESCSE